VIRLVDELDPIRRVLMEGDYAVDARNIEDLGACLLAETPHALVLCVVGQWEMLSNTVEDAQAELTNISAEHPSPRSWDLYVVVRVEQGAEQAHELERERIEHDTRYARKFVLAGPQADVTAVRRALCPLLPLRSTPNLGQVEPLDALRDSLLEQQVEPGLVDAALASFRRTGEIEVP
jgi:hypothetical protein